MSERFTLKEDGIHDKETERIFQLDKNLTNLLNTLDKMLKQQLVKTYCQDKEIQRLLNKEKSMKEEYELLKDLEIGDF